MNAVEIWDAAHKVNKVAVVLDFDGVLFDDDALQRIWISFAPREINISSETLQRACKMASGFGDRWPRIERIHKAIQAYDSMTDLPFEKFRDFVFKMTKKTAFQFQYRDADHLLINRSQYLDKMDFFILSRGDREFQMLKIQESGVGKYFEPERIFVTKDDKGPYIYEFSKSYRAILFADDKLSQLRRVHDFMAKQGAGDYPVFYLWVNRHLALMPNTTLFSLYSAPGIYPAAIDLAKDISDQCALASPCLK